MSSAPPSSPTLASSTDFIVRPAEDDDLNFVRKTWLQTHARASMWIDAVGGTDVYFREHARARDAALERGAVTIACRQAVPSGICGFSVTEEREGATLLHFVYVKARWRKLGCARLLLRPLLDRAVTFTHKTFMCDCTQSHFAEDCPSPASILRLLRVPQAWTFNPYPFLRT